MAPHSSVLAWTIPGPAEPGGLPSVGSHRVGLEWGDLAAAASFSTQLCFGDPVSVGSRMAGLSEGQVF